MQPVEDGIVVARKAAPALDGCRGPQEAANAGSAGGLPVAVGPVADEHRGVGALAGHVHDPLQPPRMRLHHADLASADDVIGSQAQSRELVARGVVGKHADLAARGAHPVEQGVDPRIAAAREGAQGPGVDPFRDDRAHGRRIQAEAASDLLRQMVLEVGKLAVAELLPERPVVPDDREVAQAAGAQRVPDERGGQPQAQGTLPIEGAIHVEHDEADRRPVEGGRISQGGCTAGW